MSRPRVWLAVLAAAVLSTEDISCCGSRLQLMGYDTPSFAAVDGGSP